MEFNFNSYDNSKQTISYCEVDKLRKCLQEIKEMLQVIMETNKVYPLQTNLEKILQKISEVVNG